LIWAFPFLKKERGGLGIYPEPGRRAPIFPSANLWKGRISVAIPNAALNIHEEILSFIGLQTTIELRFTMKLNN